MSIIKTRRQSQIAAATTTAEDEPVAQSETAVQPQAAPESEGVGEEAHGRGFCPSKFTADKQREVRKQEYAEDVQRRKQELIDRLRTGIPPPSPTHDDAVSPPGNGSAPSLPDDGASLPDDGVSVSPPLLRCPTMALRCPTMASPTEPPPREVAPQAPIFEIVHIRKPPGLLRRRPLGPRANQRVPRQSSAPRARPPSPFAESSSDDGGTTIDSDANDADMDGSADESSEDVPTSIMGMARFLNNAYDSSHDKQCGVRTAVAEIETKLEEEREGSGPSQGKKDSDTLPNVWKGTSTGGEIINGLSHMTLRARQDRVLKQWTSNGDRKNKWHDIAPHFEGAVKAFEKLTDWCPSWAFISFLPKDGSGSMFTWAPESVEAELPDLPDAMRDVMFDKLYHLRKQRAREDEKIKLTLAKERAAAESRLRRVEGELKEEREQAQKTEKQLADELAYWKAKAARASNVAASTSRRKKHA
ncbi:hypothetical protein AURDEDRAFT_173190 [Auricularia subglabra TFB-10046 SS5]|nr:hypothetical protein AURDEDRAFT_173190 [Auricularia subglabra TFB-10046 SS5]